MEVGTTVRRGRCNNVGMCENAVFQRPITVPDGEPFVCPQCLGELTDVRERQTAHKPSRVVIPLVALSVAVAVAGYAAWREYGAPHAAAPALSAASVAPAAPAETQTVTATPPAKPAAPVGSSPAPAASVSLASNTPAGPAPETVPVSPGAAAPASTQAGQVLASGDVAGGASVPGPMARQTPLASPAQPPAATADGMSAAALAVPAASAPPAAVTPSVGPQPATSDAGAAPSAAQAAAGPVAPRAVREFLGDAKPVPVTFHFRPNSVLLSTHGDRDVAHLVAYLADHHAGGAQLYLAGFTDNLGSADRNVEFARRRVATVVAALAAAGVKPAHVASFGADMPVADNATPRGREENRRVEVYLGP